VLPSGLAKANPRGRFTQASAIPNRAVTYGTGLPGHHPEQSRGSDGQPDANTRGNVGHGGGPLNDRTDSVIHFWGNILEGILWLSIAGAILIRNHGKKGLRRGLANRAAVAFFWFGISDFIEVSTGAWYKPLGLLVLKAACVGALLHCLVAYNALNRSPQQGKTQ